MCAGRCCQRKERSRLSGQPSGRPADPLAAWRCQLAAWAIPAEILAAAPESPWGFPVGLFAARASAALDAEPTPSTGQALAWLPPGGSVLDVGAGAGAASLPLARRAGRIDAVDSSAAMLAAFRAAAAAAGVPARTVLGAWPEVAGRVEPADLVVCHHVLYNVPDLAPFAQALTGHARRRVVVELTATHPLADLAPLWRHFHGLERPQGPTADAAVAALRALGLAVDRQDWQTDPAPGFERWQDVVAFTRRRLCLPPERDAELGALLEPYRIERGGRVGLHRGPRRLVTLSWPPGAAGGQAAS